MITMGLDDVIIPLHAIVPTLERELLPFLRSIRWHTWSIFVTTLKTQYFKNHPVTFYQLYQMFQKADSILHVKPLKGIGSMKPEDAARACMDPRYRRVFHVTSAGDVATIFNLLGDDSDPRKDLIAEPMLSDHYG
jgi:DNA gyrase/topoisomerase IV subunit B